MADAVAWLNAVAPWAAAGAPAVRNDLGDEHVHSDGEHGLPALSFDLTASGLWAAWLGPVLTVWPARPPGAERAALEAVDPALGDRDTLATFVEQRLAHAREALLGPARLTPSELSFGWLAIAGAQCPAVTVAWGRGLFTTVAAAHPNEEQAVLVSLTTPELDACRNSALRRWVETLRFGAERCEIVTRSRLYVGRSQRLVELALDRRSYLVGSAASCAIRLRHPSVAPEHAELALHGDRWVVGVLPGGRDRTVVNDTVVMGTRLLWGGDLIRLGDRPRRLRLRYEDDVYVAPSVRSELRTVVGPLAPGVPSFRRWFDRFEAMLPSLTARREGKLVLRASEARTFLLVSTGFTLRAGALSCAVFDPEEGMRLWNDAGTIFLAPRRTGTLLDRVRERQTIPSAPGRARARIGGSERGVLLVPGRQHDTLMALLQAPAGDPGLLVLVEAPLETVANGVVRPRDPDLAACLASFRWTRPRARLSPG